MMIKDIKTNLKTIIRDPVTILALLITIVLFFSTSQLTIWMDYTPDIFLAINAQSYAGVLVMNLIFGPIRFMAFVFMGVVIAGNIFKDKRNSVFDIFIAKDVSFLRYYISKIISFYIIAVIFCASISIVWCAAYFILWMPSEPNFDVGLFFLKFFKNMLLGYSSMLLKVIGFPIFLSALTGVPAVGAVFSAIYYFLRLVLGDPESYMNMFVHTDPGAMQRYANKLVQPEPSILVPFASDANIALLWQIGMGIALLVSSYFLLKWRFKKD